MRQDGVTRRRRRLGAQIALPFSSLVILFLGWGALWLYGRQQAATIMDAWIGREESRGRSWTCPSREITGFPLSIRITCTRPTFNGMLGRDQVQASVEHLQAQTLVYEPNIIEVTSTGPLALRMGDQSPVSIDWAALEVTIRSLAADRFRVSLTMDKPEVDAEGSTSRADRVEFRVGPTAGRPIEQKAYDVWLTLENGRIPALDALTRDQTPLALDEKGVLTQVDSTRAGSSQELMETWRRAGGRLTLSKLNMVKGGLNIDAQGDIGLDDQHRIAGRLAAALSGYETLAAQLGVPLSAVSVGGVLAQLLSRAPASDPPKQGAVNVPILFVEGRMLVGPFKTGWRLTPLY